MRTWPEQKEFERASRKAWAESLAATGMTKKQAAIAAGIPLSSLTNMAKRMGVQFAAPTSTVLEQMKLDADAANKRLRKGK